MNCCDYDCNQGRDCPARVAKIGRKIGRSDCADEPLHESSRKHYLKDLAGALLLTLAVMAVSAAVVGLLK